LNGSCRNEACSATAREKIRRRVSSEIKILSKDSAGGFGQYGVSKEFTLWTVNVNNVVIEINMFALYDGSFTYAQTAGVNEHEGKAVFQIVNMLKDFRNIITGEYAVQRYLFGNYTGPRKWIVLFENLRIQISDGTLGLIDVGKRLAFADKLFKVVSEVALAQFTRTVSEMVYKTAKMGDVTVGSFRAAA